MVSNEGLELRGRAVELWPLWRDRGWMGSAVLWQRERHVRGNGHLLFIERFSSFGRLKSTGIELCLFERFF